MLRKLLIVYFQDDIQKEIRDCLGEYYDIISANDATETQKVLMKQYRQIKLVLISMDAFRANNFAISKMMFNNLILSQIPIICIGDNHVSLNEQKRDEMDAFQNGAMDYLLPPFDKEITHNRIHNLIKLKDNASLLAMNSEKETLQSYDKKKLKGSFWNPDSLDTIIMRTYVGAACIIESIDDTITILRANDRFSEELIGKVVTMETVLTSNLDRHISKDNKEKIIESLHLATESSEEITCQIELFNLRADQPVMHVKVALKLIDQVENRILFYCTFENNTNQFEALRREQTMMEQLQVIIQNVSGGITAAYGVDDSINCLYANDEFYSMFGYSKEQFDTELFGTIYNLILPEYLPTVKETLKQLSVTGEAVQIEYMARKRDGSLIWIRSRNSSCQLDAIDKPVYITVYDDVTQSKKTEERIRNINDKLGNSQVFLQLDITNHVIEDYYSKFESVENMTKWKKDGMNGIRQIVSSIYEQDREATLQILSIENLEKRYVAGDTKFSIEYRRHMPNGEIRWFCANTILLEGMVKGTINAFIYCHDIDIRKKKRIARNKIVDTDIDAITIINIESAQARAVKVPIESIVAKGEAYNYDEVIQHFIDMEVAEENVPRCRTFFKLENLIKQVDEEGNADCSFWVIMKDGSNLRKCAHVSYLDTTKKDLLMVGRDITELFEKEQEQQLVLQHAVEVANEASLAKSDFLARMSHDMRTPLNAILGLIELAKKENTTPELDKYLKSIDISGQYLLGLINDSLDLSMIESGKLELNEEPYPLDEFRLGLDTVIRPLMDARAIEFDVNLDSAAENIVVDKLRFTQIFYNLLSNAAKYTQEGGRVEFTSEQIPPKDGKFGMRFFIRDNGIGMSKEYLKVLFDPFTREKRPELAERKGSGLGLAIVKRIVDAFDGDISVTSEVSKGTEFVVDLYAYNIRHAKPKAEAEKINLERLEGIRVLLVDDGDINIMINEKVLKSRGCYVETANNGLTALNAFTESEEGYFDIIITDVRMPVMDGLEEARRIRALDREDAKTIPIIAITADAYSDVEDRALSAGMNARLVKPVRSEKMFETIVKLLEKRDNEAVFDNEGA